MKTTAWFLSSFFLLSLLASAPRAEAEVLSATIPGSELASFVGYLETHNFRMRRAVPVPTQPTIVCVPCLTTPTGYTICADPSGPPEAPFCHQEPAPLLLKVLYERM